MNKLGLLAGSAVLAVSSFTASAQIDQVNDAQLADVDGQVLLSLYVAHEIVEASARAYIAHEVVEGAVRARVAHEVVEGVVRARVAHEVVEGAVRARVAHEVAERAVVAAGVTAVAAVAGSLSVYKAHQAHAWK